jgi:hypothetical protein
MYPLSFRQLVGEQLLDLTLADSDTIIIRLNRRIHQLAASSADFTRPLTSVYHTQPPISIVLGMKKRMKKELFLGSGKN